MVGWVNINEMYVWEFGFKFVGCFMFFIWVFIKGYVYGDDVIFNWMGVINGVYGDLCYVFD